MSEQMKEAIENLHRVYYSDALGSPDRAFMLLHHALEHCFNAAGITVSHGDNEALLKDGPTEKTWQKIEEFYSREPRA